MSVLGRLAAMKGGRYTPFVPQQDPGQDVTWWPAERNVRVPIEIGPHLAPDPSMMGGAYGEVPSRPAQIQVVTFRHNPEPMGAKSFVAHWIGPNPRAAIPRGRQQAFGARANIRRPPAVAYGSLFSAASSYPYSTDF